MPGMRQQALHASCRTRPVLFKAAGAGPGKEGGYPGKGKKESVGTFHPNRAGEFHTAMKGKRTFAFEEVSFTTPVTFSSRQETEF